MEPKLKPCPFCGGEAELKQDVSYYAIVVEDGSICNASDNVSHVRCRSCHCTTEMTFGTSDAVERWNTRVEPKDAVLRNIIDKLDDYAISVNSYCYGLPMEDDEHIMAMIKICKKTINDTD